MLAASTGVAASAGGAGVVRAEALKVSSSTRSCTVTPTMIKHIKRSPRDATSASPRLLSIGCNSRAATVCAAAAPACSCEVGDRDPPPPDVVIASTSRRDVLSNSAAMAAAALFFGKGGNEKNKSNLSPSHEFTFSPLHPIASVTRPGT